MLDWLRSYSWSVSDIVSVAGAVATVAIATLRPTRKLVRQIMRAGLMRAGRWEWHYSRWFINKWGQYDNPYLANKEQLDLSSTYVSLSFRAPEAEQETRTVAAKVLADRGSGNLIIEGAPGSGKSTLLKAYGVGALTFRRRTLRLRTRGQDIPFLVQLRKFARDLDQPGGSLAKHLLDEILVSGAGMTPADATEFLRHALVEGRALVMLDGLDEVTTDRYRAVLEAVHKFTYDQNPDQPTYRARLIVTCRRQNFLSLRDEWVPVIAQTVCTVAPLRNSEIFSYLEKLRTKFKTADGPESYFQAVRASGTLDLHRIPLILAMSVGLYARRDYFEIPNSIVKLYQTMIEEMLDRHRFKRDPGGGALAFQVDDKLCFLREFALASALGPNSFDEFGRRDLVAHARALAPHLNAVTDPDAFVKEIIDRSGLLSDVSEAGRYVFAHRSIHEHLVAEELRLIPEGATTLFDRATDPEWSQVILFYTTAQEHRSADTFLHELGNHSATLAAHCLAGAKASDDVATTILDSLRPADPVHLAALVAATMSPRVAVQEMAVSRLEAELSRSVDGVSSAFGGDVEKMLPLLGSLAGSNAARIAALVPTVVASIPDDSRLVEPLWRCLAAPDIETQPACRTIVERLLTIVMEPDGLAELEKQEPYTRAFLTDTVRRQAYPFTDGLPLVSNLVTLLAWANYLGVMPDTPNRFFEAKAADHLARVEADKRRMLSISLFWLGRILSGTGAGLSVAAAILVVTSYWHSLLLSFGWWSPLLWLGAAAASLTVGFGLSAWGRKATEGSWPRQYFASTAATKDVSAAASLIQHEIPRSMVVLAGPAAYALATSPLVTLSLPGYLATAVFGPLVLFWLPNLDLFARTTRFYLYRLNPYTDMYEDPRSRHWLARSPGPFTSDTPAASTTSTTTAQTTPDPARRDVILLPATPSPIRRVHPHDTVGPSGKVSWTGLTRRGVLVSGGVAMLVGAGAGGIGLWQLIRASSPIRTLTGHTGTVWSVTYSPNRTHLATASDDNTVRIWQADTGTLIRTLTGHTGWVRWVAFSPNGTHLATASADNTVRIWQADTGTLIRTLTGHTGTVWSVTYSPNGTHLATASDDNTVRIWQADTDTVIRTVSISTVWSVTYSPNGTHLATASDDNTVRIWQADTGTLILILIRTGHTGWVRSVAYSPNGTHLATASTDNTVRIWQADTGTLIRTLTGHTGTVWSVTYSPNGTHLATASSDRTVRIWQADTGTLIRTLTGHTDWVRSVAYSPNGTQLATASADNTVRIWRA